MSDSYRGGDGRPVRGDRVRRNRDARAQWRSRQRRTVAVSLATAMVVSLAGAAWLAWRAAPFVLDGTNTSARVIEVLDEVASRGTVWTDPESSLKVRVAYEAEGRTLEGVVTTREFEETTVMEDLEARTVRTTTVTYVDSDPSRVRAATADPEVGALIALGISGMLAIGLVVTRRPARGTHVDKPPARVPIQPAREAVAFAGRSRQGLTAPLAALGAGMMLLSVVVDEPRGRTVTALLGFVFMSLWPALSAMSARCRVRLDDDGIEAKQLPFAAARRARWEDVFHVETKAGSFYISGVGAIRAARQIRMRVHHGEGSRWIIVAPVLYPGNVVVAMAARLATADPELAGELAAMGRQGATNRERTRIDELMDRWGYLLAGTIAVVGLVVAYLA